MPLTRQQVRSVDQIAIDEFGMSGLVLMENAGCGAARNIDDFLERSGGRILILCGPGNNGGDGYVIARHLERMGHQPQIISLVPLERLTGDARSNAQIALQSEIPITFATEIKEVSAAILETQASTTHQAIVDCMLGTGANGAPRGIYRDCVELANRVSVDPGTTAIAIDLPTGLDCDTGTPSSSTFRADLTITFVDHKTGFENSAAKPFLGQIRTVEIGVPQNLLQRFGVF